MNVRHVRNLARFAIVAALALAALVAMTTVRSQEDGDDTATIEALINDIVVAFNAGDADAFNAYFTDDGIVAFVEDPSLTPDEARAAVEEFIGQFPVEIIDIRDVMVEDGTASAIVELDLDAFVSIDRFDFTEVDGTWLVSGYESGVEQPEPPEIPEGYETVHVDLFEYAFDFDVDELSAGDSVAFEAENIGDEPHELVLVMIPEDLDLPAALESGEPPEGVRDIAFTFANPGQTGIAIAEEPLDAGRYAMICFLETEDGTPHWALGMVEDFTLQGAETPTAEPTEPPTEEPTETPTTPATPTATPVAPEPPDTGTGLADGSSASSLLALSLGIAAVVLGGALAMRRAMKR